MQLKTLFPFSKAGISGINQPGGNYLENAAKPQTQCNGRVFQAGLFLH